MNVYTKDQVSAVSATLEDGSVKVTLETMLESAFFMAGLRLREKNGVRVISPIRCRIRKTCEVDLEPTSKGGPGGPFEFVLDGEGPVSIEYLGGAQDALIE